MATLDARASIAGFDMSNGTMVNFDAYLSNNSAFYSWRTTLTSDPENYIHAYGSGITTDVTTFYPTGGSITSLQIDLEHDAAIDATITLTAAVPLTSLVSPAGTNTQTAGDKFWEAILSGNDRIYAPNAGRSLVFGDFLQVFSNRLFTEYKTGGDDTISAAPTAGDSTQVVIGTRGSSGTALVGDAYLVDGAPFNGIAYYGVLNGGRDTITLTGRAAYNLVGDAYTVGELGEVHGGADTIRSDATTSALVYAPVTVLVGEAFRSSGYVSGGADTITGSNFAFLDEFQAGDVWLDEGTTIGGADTINGRAGHDFISGDVGAAGGSVTGGGDTLNGGEDSDIIAGDVLQAGNDGPFGNFGVGAARVTIVGGNDTVHGDQGNDIIAGDIYLIASLTADSSIRGGNDKLYGDDGNDTLYGDFGPGDLIAPASFFDNGGNDVLDGGRGADDMYGGGGNDTFYVDSSGDKVSEVAGQGSDRVLTSISYTLGSAAAVEFFTTTSHAGTAALALTGNGFAQTIWGNAGANVLKGAAGNDVLMGRLGADVLDGGADVDSASYAEAAAGVFADLSAPAANTGEAAGDTYVSIENLIGSNFADNLRGTNGSGTVLGGGGADLLYGRNGNDVLNGEAGNDTLNGGANADIFLFDQTLTAANADKISDFTPIDDTIHIDNAVFAGLSTGTLTSGAFRSNTTGLAGDSSDRIVYETDTGKLYFDRDGTGGTYGSIHFATLTNFASLGTITAADFVVI